MDDEKKWVADRKWVTDTALFIFIMMICLSIPYLIGSFMLWDLDVSNWHSSDRMVLIGSYIFFIFIAGSK